MKKFNCDNSNNCDFNNIDKDQEYDEFYCRNCNLVSLDKLPNKIKKFDCSKNKFLKNLLGGPQIVEKYICKKCDLIELTGAPEKVKIFDCSFNPSLSSLEAGPIEAKRYYCSFCGLESLIGAPFRALDFDCSFNDELKDLSGMPKYMYVLSISENKYLKKDDYLDFIIKNKIEVEIIKVRILTK